MTNTRKYDKVNENDEMTSLMMNEIEDSRLEDVMIVDSRTLETFKSEHHKLKNRNEAINMSYTR